MDQWTTYLVRAAAVVLILWFGYQGVQRAVVDHLLAVQAANILRQQVAQCSKEIQNMKIKIQAEKLGAP